MAEERNFRMHEELLRSVIKKQAGTLQKALLEGVMNSIEASATTTELTIEPRIITITDNGRGFTSREEIELFFETFGQPHDEKENKIWAQFRMGRGQMFAFGRNIWRTGPFSMVVDINERLGYSLTENLPEHQGCIIEIYLYEALTPREMAFIEKETGKYIKYVEPIISINEKQANTPASKCKWDKVSTDDAYIKLKETGMLAVYNKGVFVRDFHQGEYGCAGTVVSKERLDVNFARNDIIRSCPVWRRIRPVIDSQNVTKARTVRALNQEQRVNIINRIVTGELKAYDFMRTKLFTDVAGTVWSVSGIQKSGFCQWTLAPAGSRVGDILIAQGQCLALSEEHILEFGLDNPATLFELFHLGWRERLEFVPFDEIRQQINDESSPLPQRAWTPKERVWLSVLQLMYRQFINCLWQDPSYKEQVNNYKMRDLRIGASQVHAAWTDGISHITFARKCLENLPLMGKTGFVVTRSIVKAAQLMAHELCHTDDCITSVHGPDFDRLYRGMDESIASACHHAMNEVNARWYDKAIKRETENYKRENKEKTSKKEPKPDETSVAACSNEA